MIVTLLHDIQTSHGYYPAGLKVTWINGTENGVRVCLDPVGVHIGKRCHLATIPDGWATDSDYVDAQPGIYSDTRTELVADVGGFQRKRGPRRSVAL